VPLKDASIVDFRFHDLRHCAFESQTGRGRHGDGYEDSRPQIEKLWKPYNAIDEEDLTQAAKTLNTYLQRNTPGTLDGTDQPAHQAK